MSSPCGRGKACTARFFGATGSLIYGRVARVDVDALVALRSQEWNRLEELAGQRRLTGEEAGECVRLYQQTAADLSTLRSLAPEPALVDRLSHILRRPRRRSTGAPEVNLGALRRLLL